ncbi:50S ribosomal protein L3 [Patescibacteria group bacterium]|nr:50S ribosomal protein L3 [Patescibacteria group bacterium]MBU4381152.1 50S ribosomal protein L3 [Patescibacteria group bacterium]
METKLLGTKKDMGLLYLENGDVVPFTTVVLSVWPEKELAIGQKIKLKGVSKGRGFSGVMKRWGHKGGPATHGQSDRQRAIGSTGPSTPGRVFKGLKMPGHFGNASITVPGSKIVGLEKEKLEIKVLGGVPGARRSKVQVEILT